MQKQDPSMMKKEFTFNWKMIKSKLDSLENYIEEYEELDSTLSTLPHKLQHKIMVPFGSVAFFEGEIINTNKILVLLGDNYFVNKSVKQARELIERRIKCKTKKKKKIYFLKIFFFFKFFFKFFFSFFFFFFFLKFFFFYVT